MLQPCCSVLLTLCLVLLVGTARSQQLSGGGFLARAGANAVDYPEYNVPSRVLLPQLNVLQNGATFHFAATQITGPGDNSSQSDPYLMYTGRTFNHSAVAGVLRVKQGETMRVRVCNDLSANPYTLDPDQTASYAIRQGPNVASGNNYKTDPNIYANHLHGIYGNPGTNNIPCNHTDAGIPCYRGDNIFEDILPGSCQDYQYDIPTVHAPGTLWMHPHHHGAGSIQTQLASVPAFVDPNPGVGFDFFNTPSCQAVKPYMQADNEIIMHMQTFMMAVNLDGLGIGSDPTGPTDDGYIEISTTMEPQDPYCCAGPDEDTDAAAGPVPEGQTTWLDVGTPEGAGNETGPSISTQPFYTSGANAQFTIINGAYQPIIQMTANRAYRWRMIQAATMKWMDLSIAEPGCQIGLYGRDGNVLHSLPRNTDHVGMVAANRAEMFVSCAPGNYTLRTGYGPLHNDPQCQSTHCELMQQEVLATIVVTEDNDTRAPLTNGLFGMNCQPVFPAYLQSLRYQNASNRDTLVSRQGLFNFTGTNPGVTAESAACSINGAVYTQLNAIQEEIGAVHELDLENINVHSYHHHVQPYEIVSLGNNYKPDNGSWQVGDWADVLTRFDDVSSAVVRWRPGPYEITGTGYSVVHCHILPHNDEGCVMNFQLLNSTPANQVQPAGRSQGYKAGVTLAGIFATIIFFGGIIFLVKRRKARKQRQAALAAPLVVGGLDVESQASGSESHASGSGSSQDSLANIRKAHAV